jgi:hypothetical protein
VPTIDAANRLAVPTIVILGRSPNQTARWLVFAQASAARMRSSWKACAKQVAQETAHITDGTVVLIQKNAAAG